MPLDDLSTKITNLRDKAAESLAAHRAGVNEIRADGTLSISGKVAKLAENYLAARKHLGDLRETEVTALANARNELERRLFGQFSNDPSAIIAYRDAQDRASRLKYDQQDEAASLLRTALLSDDTTLTAAIVSRAMSAGWEKVINVFADARPNEASQINDLADIIHFQDDQNMEFKRSLAYELTPPSEIGRQSDRALTELASGTQVRNNIYANGQLWA